MALVIVVAVNFKTLGIIKGKIVFKHIEVIRD